MIKLLDPSDEGVHLSHCYQGEYEGGCKYGDENCAASPEYRKLKIKTSMNKEFSMTLVIYFNEKQVGTEKVSDQSHAEQVVKEYKESLQSDNVWGDLSGETILGK